MFNLPPFPSTFRLKNLVAITARGFELKVNPYSAQADRATREWFKSFAVYNESKQLAFLERGRFDVFAAFSFPDADLEHLETCLAFFFWAFATDDLSDEGDFQAKPEAVREGIDISNSILYKPRAPRPDHPYSAMLHDLLRRIRATATPGASYRFARAFEQWSSSQIKQSHNRLIDRIPPVGEFILMRRATIGAAMVEAMVEYSLDIDLPDYVFEDPTVIAMSEATSDIMTWPNDLCSFNKEQADGDLQNLVCCIMVEHRVGLQDAIDILTRMIDDRVGQYIELKSQLPSFGPEVDAELARYHKALEHFVQGTVLWYYRSPRYFRDAPHLGHEEILITLYQQTAAEPRPQPFSEDPARRARL
ncbi:isoprenoid synthase domain-containing protein [Infundibulicybe gibba]|nr:isoprenoid synthase domain-containing protein [Infundibulicybe gibba]